MIEDFSQGDMITGFFVLASHELKQFDGGEMLKMVLQDASGRIDAVAWEEAGSKFIEIDGVEVVKVRGQVGAYRNKPQLRVMKIRAAQDDEYEVAELLPTVDGGVDRMHGEFDSVVDLVEDEFIRELLRLFRADSDLFDAYIHSPAGKRFHHDYIGGLAEHSISMARLGNIICSHYPELDRDLLICGALFHDIGKVRELMRGVKLNYTDEGRLIGHITLGDQIITELISKIPDFPEKYELKIRHLIASHHGEFEYGSPVLPQIREAWVLHHIDKIDSGLNVFHDYDRKRSDDWSDFVNLWKRYLYFG